RHDAHLEQRLDHVATLHRQLLGEVGHGDRLADRHFAHDRRGQAGEAGAGAGLVAVLARGARLGTRGGAARAVGRGQGQLAGEARGILVVLDARDHRMRTAGLVLVPAAVVAARRRRLRVSVAMWLARGGFVLGGRRGRGRGHFGLDAQALGFLFFLAPAFGGCLGAALVLLGRALLLGQVAQPRFLALAQDLGALVVAGRGGGGRRRLGNGFPRLDQGDLLAHDDIDRGAVLAAADGEFLLAAAAERDLLRCDRIL